MHKYMHTAASSSIVRRIHWNIEQIAKYSGVYAAGMYVPGTLHYELEASDASSAMQRSPSPPQICSPVVGAGAPKAASFVDETFGKAALLLLSLCA